MLRLQLGSDATQDEDLDEYERQENPRIPDQVHGRSEYEAHDPSEDTRRSPRLGVVRVHETCDDTGQGQDEIEEPDTDMNVDVVKQDGEFHETLLVEVAVWLGEVRSVNSQRLVARTVL